MAMDYSALPLGKDSREDGKRKRNAVKHAILAHEKAEKARVVKRDGKHTCRLVPNCIERGPYETAHLDNKGMGGDHGRRSVSALMIRACFAHHRGNWSLHSNDLRVEYLTSDQANGPIEVWGKDKLGVWYLLGRETAPGQWERD